MTIFRRKTVSGDEKILLQDVFIPGGNPTYTFVERPDKNLTPSIQQWFKFDNKLLSVLGPTKSGKTVQIRRAVGDSGVWIDGGAVQSEAEFWDFVCDGLDLALEKQYVSERNSTVGSEGGLTSFVTATLETIEEFREELTEVRRTSPKVAALSGIKDLDVALIVDDFHYIDASVQASIVRSLKAPVFEGAKIILVTVPHRTYDAVRVEKEMTGRFSPLGIGLWDQSELEKIAVQGFSKLNCDDTDSRVTKKLAVESFGNPLLMQDFCQKWCLEQGVVDSEHGRLLEVPTDEFFVNLTKDAAKSAFDRIVIGPSQRSDRIRRRYISGGGGDIYEAVLRAIASTGPKLELKYEEIRFALREIVVADDIPQKQEITNVLDNMTKICKEKIDGEPILEYDREVSTLFIADPFFAYYLKWNESNSAPDGS